MKKHLKKAATVLACTGMVAGAFTTTAFAEDAEQITEYSVGSIGTGKLTKKLVR